MGFFDQHACLNQTVKEINPEGPGEVVVASPGRPQYVATLSVAQCRHWSRGSDGEQDFENACDCWRGELVVAVTTLALDSESAAFNEASKMGAGGGRSQSSGPGKFAGGERPAVKQDEGHIGSSSLRKECRHNGDVGVNGHGSLYIHSSHQPE